MSKISNEKQSERQNWFRRRKWEIFLWRKVSLIESAQNGSPESFPRSQSSSPRPQFLFSGLQVNRHQYKIYIKYIQQQKMSVYHHIFEDKKRCFDLGCPLHSHFRNEGKTATQHYWDLSPPAKLNQKFIKEDLLQKDQSCWPEAPSAIICVNGSKIFSFRLIKIG